MMLSKTDVLLYLENTKYSGTKLIKMKIQKLTLIDDSHQKVATIVDRG